MWPAGKYVPQTRAPPADSIGEWVKGKESIENEDILVYVTVGTTHVPRPEDWPVYVLFPSLPLHVILQIRLTTIQHAGGNASCDVEAQFIFRCESVDGCPWDERCGGYEF